jgi:hypothetical protein
MPHACPSKTMRAQGRPDARCTRGLMCSKRSTRVRNHRYAGNAGLPCAMVLTLLRALLGVHDLVSHRRPQITACRACNGRHRQPARLAPAQGRQDHTTSQSANRAARPARASASIASRPTFVTTRTPLCSRRDSVTLDQFPKNRKINFFAIGSGQTGQLLKWRRQICPSGKSVASSFRGSPQGLSPESITTAARDIDRRPACPIMAGALGPWAIRANKTTERASFNLPRMRQAANAVLICRECGKPQTRF